MLALALSGVAAACGRTETPAPASEAAVESVPSGNPPSGYRGQHPSVFENFITARGDSLMDGDREYRFVSAATPTLGIVEDNYPFEETDQFEWRWPDGYEIRDHLETVAQMGGQATRIYCLSVRVAGEARSIPRHILEVPRLEDGSTNLAAFNEEGFRTLDRVLAMANEIGVRIVLPITNQWSWHGGVKDLAAFRGKTFEEFFSDPELIADFKAVIDYLLQRTNTYTGVKYRDDKAILAWAYGNELAAATAGWLSGIGAHIKGVDPNHLLMHHEFAVSRGLEVPQIDVVATSIYDDFRGLSPLILDGMIEQAEGVKPYVAFEFGFATPEVIEQVLQAVIDRGVAGLQLWSLRNHNRDGGFYWHGEEAYGEEFFLRSYHWPGFPSGERYDEARVLDLLRHNAYAIQGMDAPPLEKPDAPKLLPIQSASAISWQGSVGASSYVVERSTDPERGFRVVAQGVTDDVAYTPIFNDTTAEVGSTYYYRVRAHNEAGLSRPSNGVGPVRVEELALVDDLSDLSQVHDISENLALVTFNNRPVLERLSRVTRTDAVAAEALTYMVEGNMRSFRVQAFFKDEIAPFSFFRSSDGVTYQEITPTISHHGEGPGVYGYWYRVSYQSDLPANARYLRIEFPGLETADSPQLSRVEIKYLPLGTPSER